MRTMLLTFIMLLISTVPASATGIPLVFKVKSGVDLSEVFITFYNCISHSSSITGTYNKGSAKGQVLDTKHSYSLSDLVGTESIATGVPAGVPAVLINNFDSGRIFISYKSGMKTFGCTQPSVEPSSNDKSLSIRYQPMELDIESGIVGKNSTPIINTNLTYIDYAAIALSLTVVNATTSITNNPLLTTVSSETLTDILGKTTKVAYTAVQPSSADRLPSSSFTRVLSPTSADESAQYSDWTNYLKTFLQGKTVKIAGLFGGVGGQPANAAGGPGAATARNQTQSYDYLVTFDATGKATMTAQAGSGDGTVAGIAAVNRGDGVGLVDITIEFADLNAATGIYGNNPAYTIVGVETTAGVQNDYYGWVVGDLLAGLSWGLPGSTVLFNSTTATNVQIGSLTSVEWWGGVKADGTGVSVPLSPVGKGYVYSKAQPAGPLNYHTYAAGLVGITGAYGFGLQDRAGQTLINFNRIQQPNAYLEVGIDTKGKSAVVASSMQASGIVVTIDEFTPKKKTSTELESTYSLGDFNAFSSVCSFNATINTNGGHATFMMDSNEIPTGSPTTLRLMKLYSNGTSMEYADYAPTGPIFSDGSWWLTDLAGNHILPSDKITLGTHYYIHFVIKDNGLYDENGALGQITDPVVLGISTSGTGCVLNPNAGFSLELASLFILGMIGIVLRKYLNKS
ncbi:beta-1,3-glucanase family protein [Maridesulfovibrio hydrothermalis]|nr:beta-1,3-glucanase family protein [Maridesulfovibrio hydrothermalis]